MLEPINHLNTLKSAQFASYKANEDYVRALQKFFLRAWFDDLTIESFGRMGLTVEFLSYSEQWDVVADNFQVTGKPESI